MTLQPSSPRTESERASPATWLKRKRCAGCKSKPSFAREVRCDRCPLGLAGYRARVRLPWPFPSRAVQPGAVSQRLALQRQPSSCFPGGGNGGPRGPLDPATGRRATGGPPNTSPWLSPAFPQLIFGQNRKDPVRGARETFTPRGCRQLRLLGREVAAR